MKFKVGDIVRLKSGSPNMTVEELERPMFATPGTHTTVRCTWFAGKRHQTASFELDAIELVPAEDAQGETASPKRKTAAPKETK